MTNIQASFANYLQAHNEFCYYKAKMGEGAGLSLIVGIGLGIIAYLVLTSQWAHSTLHLQMNQNALVVTSALSGLSIALAGTILNTSLRLKPLMKHYANSRDVHLALAIKNEGSLDNAKFIQILSEHLSKKTDAERTAFYETLNQTFSKRTLNNVNLIVATATESIYNQT